jgi:hypothetical protein
VLRAVVLLALVGGVGHPAESQDERSAFEGRRSLLTVLGRLVDRQGNPVDGAELRVETEFMKVSTLVGRDGTFVISIPSSLGAASVEEGVVEARTINISLSTSASPDSQLFPSLDLAPGAHVVTLVSASGAPIDLSFGSDADVVFVAEARGEAKKDIRSLASTEETRRGVSSAQTAGADLRAWGALEPTVVAVMNGRPSTRSRQANGSRYLGRAAGKLNLATQNLPGLCERLRSRGSVPESGCTALVDASSVEIGQLRSEVGPAG